MTRRRALAALAVAGLLCGCAHDTQPAARPTITVSGISSGAYMATQVHVAHSARVAGAGLIAGGPYDCAQGELGRALGPCIGGDGLDVAALVVAARAAAEDGAIDPVSALEGDRVWLFHGGNDTAVAAAVVAAAADMYGELAGIDAVLIDDVPAAHGIPTVDAGVACDEFAPPYLQACGYDAAGALLEHLLGPLEPAVAPDGEIVTVDQREFADASLADSGYAYVPPACRGGGCRLHIVFHGCGQGAAFVDDAVVRGAGYNRWAEANDLIVFYPQVAASRAAPMNPLGCWDWWGYTGDGYATRDGAQVRAVMTLADRLAGTP